MWFSKPLPYFVSAEATGHMEITEKQTGIHTDPGDIPLNLWVDLGRKKDFYKGEVGNMIFF